jgi:hypothetical protein
MSLLFIKYFLTGFLSIFLNLSGADPSPSLAYPVPPVNENSLFYIQRSKNTNAIVYEVNRKPDGKINADDPVKIYWLRYATDSTTADLTFIQRKYAYGIESKPYKNGQDAFVIQLVSYRKKNIFLLPTSGGKSYSAFININGKVAELKRIFVATSGGTFWFPKVDYIELSGIDPVTRQKTIERFVPN